MTTMTSATEPFATRLGTRLQVDAVIALAAWGGTTSQFAHGGATPLLGAQFVGVLLAVGSTMPLLLWRWYPLGVFAVTAVASALLAGLGYPVDLILGPTVAIYLLAASREPERPWTMRTTGTVVALLLAYLAAAGIAQRGFPGIELLHTGLAAAAAWFAGERTRLRRDQTAELHARAVRAEREAERDRQLAVAEERARIARDLHDSAGHAISVIAVRAGAARLRHPKDPQRSLEALTAIEDLARQTVADIDQFVGTLRQSDGTVDAPPGLASLDTLIARHRASGLDVTVDRSGMPLPLGGVADQAAYRILQEALTNAARYGTGTARVALGFGDEQLEVTVTNPVAPAATARPSGGHGLIGMAERAALLGGAVDTDRANGSFQLRALIPYRRSE